MSVQAMRWTREEYDRLVALGILGGRRVQLLEGEIVEMTPQGAPHATGVYLVQRALTAIVAPDHMIRTQLPLALGADSEPEPDVAVVAGDPRKYAQHHPTMAVLVVEVADASLDFDRERKRRIYAAAGIPEYWLVNLPERRVEVYREPASSTAGSNADYRQHAHYGSQESLSLLRIPGASIAVSDLLP